MKSFAIVLKDLRLAFRSPFLLAFMLILPLLQAGIPYLAFGGGQPGLDVSVTRVQVVNLDRPIARYPDFVAGQLLIEMMFNEELKEVLSIVEVSDEQAARAAVDDRQAAVAVVIPIGFTASLFDPNEHAAISLYHDPALVLAPAIVKEVIVNFTDGFAGSLLAADVTAAQGAAHSQPIDDATRQAVMRQYGDWALTIGESLQKKIHPAIAYRAASETGEATSSMQAMIGSLMQGMLVFFVFFVGTLAAQSIIREMEQGTLSRLYKTPTPETAILLGKYAAIGVILIIQIVLLIASSALLFGIAWGAALPVALAGLALAVAATGFGILTISFLRNSRRAFLMIGGVVIVTSLAGGAMTTTFANLPPLFKTVSLLTPQGWTLQAFALTARSSGIDELLIPVLAAVAFGLICLSIGTRNLKRRLA